MQKNITLLIMAAGMGSRYGGLKQIEPIGPNGEFLIDYSIYDAIKIGFNKIVFVIKKENEQIFRDTVGRHIPENIKVEYAFQEITDVPKGYRIPITRNKPWGTAHAVYSARHLIHEPFAVINADDFYGRDAYKVVYQFLTEKHKQISYCVVGYLVQNTLSSNGAVKRAIVEECEGSLVRLTESSVLKKEHQIYATPLNGGQTFKVENNTLVCMNMLGFTPDLFDYIKKDFAQFLKDHQQDLTECEYFVPDVICGTKNKGLADVKVISTSSKWEGITYKEDKSIVKKNIENQIQNGIYPFDLWGTAQNKTNIFKK